MDLEESGWTKFISEQIRIDFENPKQIPLDLYLVDLNGAVIQSANSITGSSYILEKDGLQKGIYMLLIKGMQTISKLIILN